MYVSSGSACTEKNSQTPMDPRAVTAQDRRIARIGNRFVRGNVALNVIVQTLGGVGIGTDVPSVTELSSAADFRNSPGCDTAILGNGSLYGGRLANGSQAPGLDEGGAMLPLSLGGNVMGSTALPGTPSVAPAGAPAAVAASGAPGAPAPAPGSGTPVGPGTSGAYEWWNNRRAGRKACVTPSILPLMTVFPIGAPPAASSTPAVSAAPGADMNGLVIVGLGGLLLWALAKGWK